jgi:hypothetical protein
MKRQTRFVTVLSILAIGLLLSACGGGAASNTSGGGDPAAAAKAFFDALYGGNPVDSMICSAAGSAAADMQASLEQMRDTLTASGATVDTSGLTFTTSNQSGDTADVTVGGNLKVTVSGVTTDTPFTGAVMKMRNEGGSWKVCG